MNARCNIILIISLFACSVDAASSHPTVGQGDRAEAPAPTADPGPPECGTAADCFPQQPAHGTWCGPIEQDFTGTVVETVLVEGTLDGSGVGEGGPGCRCVEGRCGALLNDGRLVVGPQPPAEE